MQNTTNSKTMEQLVTEFATAESNEKTWTAKKDEARNGILALIEANPELYKDRIVKSQSGEIVYKVSATEQVAINKDYQPSDKVVNNLIQLVQSNPTDYLTVALAKANGLKPTDDNIGEGKPFVMKPVKARFTRQ